MDMIMENPVLWGAVFIVVLLGIITVISIIITKKRRKEVEEIEKMFPAGNMTSEDVQISMDRFKRERQKRKQKPRIHRERPTEAHPDEDKEIVVRDPEELLKRKTNSKPNANRSGEEKRVNAKADSSLVEESTRKKESSPQPEYKEREQQTVKHKHNLLNSKAEEGFDKEKGKDHSLTLNKKTKKPKKNQGNEEKPLDEKQQEAMDKKASRRLYKRSLLKPEKNEESKSDSGKHPKASLIGSKAASGYNKDEAEQDQQKTPSRAKHYAGKSLFSKKHKWE